MAKDLCQDLVELAGFLQGQRQVMNDAAFDVACSSHAENVKRRIDGLPSLETKDATELLKAVNGLPFQAPVKQDLSEAVSKVLLRPAKPQGSQRPLQTCTTFGSFLSKQDRQILADSEIMDSDKLDRLAVRAISVGLVYPNEQTFGHLVAVGLATGLQGQNHEDFMEHVLKLKAKLKHRREPLKHEPYDRNFPTSPKQLPPAVFQKVYGEDELAEEIPAGVMRRIMNDIGALRKNHNKIKSSSSAMVASSSSTSRKGSAMDQGFQFMHMMFEYMQQQKEQSAAGGVHFTFPQKKARAQKALPGPAEPEEKPARADAPASGPGGSDLQEAPPGNPAATESATPSPTRGVASGGGMTEGTGLLALTDVNPAQQAAWLEEEPDKAKAAPKQMKKRPASAASIGNLDSKKKIVKRPASKGWTREERYRQTGQCDKYFISPDGEVFRLRHEAEAAGYKD